MDVWSQTEVVGTAVTVTGAMIMILVKGPLIPLPWTVSTNPEGLDVTKVKGPFFVTTFCPLSSVMVAIIASSVLAVQLSLGSYDQSSSSISSFHPTTPRNSKQINRMASAG